MSIDNLVPDPWPGDIVEVLDRWRQGHLLEQGALIWLAEGGMTDLVTGVPAGGTKGKWRAQQSDSNSSPKYVAIVSQTCDVAATGPGARHPTVQVCPARCIDGASPEKIKAIKRHEVVEYVYLTQFLKEQHWVIDLRMSLPLSKFTLVGRKPIVGFASEIDEIALAQHLASKFERIALHDHISTGMVGRLREHLRTNKSNTEWWEKVEQVRLVVDGNRLAPVGLQMIVVEESPLDRREKKIWRDWRKAEAKRLDKLDIKFEPVRFADLGTLSVREYRDSVPVPLPSLQRGRF